MFRKGLPQMGLFNVVCYLIPRDYREQCLGDLYERFYRLREQRPSKLVSVMLIAWHLLSLTFVGLQMRWEDLLAARQEKYKPQSDKGTYMSIITLFLPQSTWALSLILPPLCLALILIHLGCWRSHHQEIHCNYRAFIPLLPLSDFSYYLKFLERSYTERYRVR